MVEYVYESLHWPCSQAFTKASLAVCLTCQADAEEEIFLSEMHRQTCSESAWVKWAEVLRIELEPLSNVGWVVSMDCPDGEKKGIANFSCGTHVNGAYQYLQVLKLGDRPHLALRNSDNFWEALSSCRAWFSRLRV